MIPARRGSSHSAPAVPRSERRPRGSSVRRQPRAVPRLRLPALGSPGRRRAARSRPLPQRAGTPGSPHLPYLGVRPPSRKESWRRRRGGRRKEGKRKGERHRTASLRPGKAPPPPPPSPAELGSPRRKQRGQALRGATALVWAPSALGADAALRKLNWAVSHPLNPSGAAWNPVREVQEKGKLRNSEQVANAPSKSRLLAPAGCKLCDSCALTPAFLLANHVRMSALRAPGWAVLWRWAQHSRIPSGLCTLRLLLFSAHRRSAHVPVTPGLQCFLRN